MPSPWFFPDIDEMMREMEREFRDIENLIPKELIREKKQADGSVKKEIGPIVYGYSMTIDPDGRPMIREFGNVKRGASPWKELTEKREPLVDVVDAETEVRVIAELPGVNKDDINVMVDGNKLVISVDTEGRKYYKELELPVPVRADIATSKYNNGMLEITLKKQSSDRGTRLKIE
jgi:HSP20 family protein